MEENECNRVFAFIYKNLLVKVDASQNVQNAHHRSRFKTSSSLLKPRTYKT